MDEEQIADNELKQLLIKIAHADTEEDSDIYDHPCSIAIRRMNELKEVSKLSMCDCHSYNGDFGGAEEVILGNPFTGKPVSIDRCISKVVGKLWIESIETIGSCCGHGKIKPSIILGDCSTDDDLIRVGNIIKELDGREFDIQQWRLTTVKSAITQNAQR